MMKPKLRLVYSGRAHIILTEQPFTRWQLGEQPSGRISLMIMAPIGRAGLTIDFEEISL